MGISVTAWTIINAFFCDRTELAIENLALLDDALRRSVLQTVNGAAPGPIDTSEPENMSGPVRTRAERVPGILRGEASAASL